MFLFQAPGQPPPQNPFGMKSKGRSPYAKTNAFTRPSGPPGTQPLGPRPFGGPPVGEPRMQHQSGNFSQQIQPPPISGSLSWPGSPDGDNKTQQSHASLPPSFSQPAIQPAANLFAPQLNGSFDQTQNSQSVDHITSSFNTQSTQNMNSVNSPFIYQGKPSVDNVNSTFTNQGNSSVDNVSSAFTNQGNPTAGNVNSAFTTQGNLNVDGVDSAFNRLTLDSPSVSGIPMQSAQKLREKQGYQEGHDNDYLDESDESSSDPDTDDDDDDDLSSDDPSSDSDELAQTGDSQRTAGELGNFSCYPCNRYRKVCIWFAFS